MVHPRHLLEAAKADYVALRAQGHFGEEIRQVKGPCGEHGYVE